MSHVNTPPNHEVFDHNTVTTDGQDQPTATPQPKVIAATIGAGVGAATSTLLVYIIEEAGRIDLPDTVEGAIGVLITAGVAFIAGYIKRPSAIS